MTKIFTRNDARQQKLDAELPALDHAAIAAAEARRIEQILAANPEIGVLQQGASVQYYAYLNGYSAEPTVVDHPARLAALLVQF